jgi:hypothetical protein
MLQKQTSVDSVQVRKVMNHGEIIHRGMSRVLLRHDTPTDSSMSSDAQNQTSVGSVQVREGKNHRGIIQRGTSRVLLTSRNPNRFLRVLQK